jgi:hypothetical protein
MNIDNTNTVNRKQVEQFVENLVDEAVRHVEEQHTHVTETPVEETHPTVTETPVEETHPTVTETPVEETPVEETPVEETPVEETPVEETPVEETPVEETPVEETPVEETPVEETPVEEDLPEIDNINELTIVNFDKLVKNFDKNVVCLEEFLENLKNANIKNVDNSMPSINRTFRYHELCEREVEQYKKVSENIEELIEKLSAYETMYTELDVSSSQTYNELAITKNKLVEQQNRMTVGTPMFDRESLLTKMETNQKEILIAKSRMDKHKYIFSEVTHFKTICNEKLAFYKQNLEKYENLAEQYVEYLDVYRSITINNWFFDKYIMLLTFLSARVSFINYDNGDDDTNNTLQTYINFRVSNKFIRSVPFMYFLGYWCINLLVTRNILSLVLLTTGALVLNNRMKYLTFTDKILVGGIGLNLLFSNITFLLQLLYNTAILSYFYQKDNRINIYYRDLVSNMANPVKSAYMRFRGSPEKEKTE